MHLSSETTENRFPSAVFMKITGQPVEPDRQSVASQVDLMLTLRFGQQRVELKTEEGERAGTVRFGIRRGVLRLTLAGCTMPMETQGLTPSLAPTVRAEDQTEVSGRLVISGSRGPEGQVSGRTSSKSQPDQPQYYAEGTEEEPVWKFEVQGAPSLRGRISASLGILKASDISCQVDATFEVESMEDVYLSEVRDVLSDGLSPNRVPTLESWLFNLLSKRMLLRIAQSQLETELRDPLSRVKLNYD